MACDWDRTGGVGRPAWCPQVRRVVRTGQQSRGGSEQTSERKKATGPDDALGVYTEANAQN